MSHQFASQCVHSGEWEDASAVPIFQGVTAGEQYVRGNNPTINAFEHKVKALEGGAFSVALASGMGAIFTALFSLLTTGDRLVCHRHVFGVTKRLLGELASHVGIDVQFVDLTNPDNLAAALRVKTRLVYFEPLSNPHLDILDTRALATLAHDSGALVVVDNTFLSPYVFRPLTAGADVVIHSATKYLCGHGDACAGIVTTNQEEICQAIFHMKQLTGAVLSPMNAYLLIRGIKTLPLRMRRHCDNAMQVAQFLSQHEFIKEVRYPSLPAMVGHEIAARDWDAFGGMIAMKIGVANSKSETRRKQFLFLNGLKLCKVAWSLGDPSTLVTRYNEFIRISVGLEDPRDILADLSQALAR